MICPNCQSDVAVSEKDFGALFTCPKCQSGYFINFAGLPEYSDLPPPSEEFPAVTIDVPPSNLSDDLVESVPENDLKVEVQDFQTFETNNFEPMNSFVNSEFQDAALEISNFGNSETQIAALSYDLHLKGLDTRDVQLAFKEVIEDARFSWDFNDLMKQIKNGELVLRRLNPVQAFILAKRIHFIDVEMKWTQNALD
jgi:hypothetical protein